MGKVLSGQMNARSLCEIIPEEGHCPTTVDRYSRFLVIPKRNMESLHKSLKDWIDVTVTKTLIILGASLRLVLGRGFGRHSRNVAQP
jgi:hypothetical protein